MRRATPQWVLGVRLLCAARWILALAIFLISTAQSHDFARLDSAIASPLVAQLAPVFDFDGDGCLPSALISRTGQQNGGLKPSGTIGGECRLPNFLDASNTLHRSGCTSYGGSTYCGHFYVLYFEKDQCTDGRNPFCGHRHDIEHAIIWTKNGVVTHGSVSGHGNVTTRPTGDLPKENGHMKVVYHREGLLTHSMRFAKPGETAENPYGKFVTPAIVSWSNLRGDGVDNRTMAARLNGFNFGKAVLPITDNNFVDRLNRYKPAGYPEFTWSDVTMDASEHKAICYRTHVRNIGWLPPICDGAVSGTTGKGLQMEAIAIWTQKPGLSVCYQAHVGGLGWLKEVCDGEVAGTVNQSRRLEALRIRLARHSARQERLEYQAHVQERGWQPPVAEDGLAGTVGERRRMEAIRIWMR